MSSQPHLDTPAIATPGIDASSARAIAVIGAGPVGLALALQAARALPEARISLFDRREATHDVRADGRTLALSLGSVQVLERLGAWRAIEAESCPITAVHVSQQQPSVLWASLASALGPGADRAAREPELLITAAECGVERLGAVASYGHLVAPLQAVWEAEVAREPQRLSSRFGQPVAALKNLDAAAGGGVEVDAGVAERFDLAVVAEGGVFARQAPETPPSRRPLGLKDRPPVRHDYGQTAWVGQVTLDATGADAVAGGCAYERFTPQGPAALLPLPPQHGQARAALVWCVDGADDPVRGLDDAQRLAVLNSVFPARVGRLVGITPLKAFPLGLIAERTLVEGRSVRIGNAAQTLHPVAGQGLNLGLRDAHALVAALRRPIDIDTALRSVEWQRAPDRWALIAATDFLARSFTWRLPGLNTARGLGLAALQALGPAKRALAQQMMFGWR